MKALTHIMYLIVGISATTSATVTSTMLIAEGVTDPNTFSAVAILMFIMIGMSGLICTFTVSEILIERKYPEED